MNKEEFLEKHSDTLFAFHKIERYYKVHYVNTEVGIAVTGTICNHSNLETAEDGHSLTVELGNFEVIELPK